MFGRKILVLVPHPDDEIVGMACSIARAKAEGAEVFALYLTHGCIAKDVRWFWDKPRHAQHVAKRLDEKEKTAAFLGLTPVGQSGRAARNLWRDMACVQREIAHAVTAHAIDQIWVPAYEGGNADHDALNAIASLYRSSLSVLEFAEYNFANQKSTPQTFPFPNGTEQTVILTDAERDTKTRALKIYESEQCNLGYVGVDHETYRPLATYAYDKPPHTGTLWYARFQWVPFAHPRVDFTNPQEVSDTIMAFLKSAPAI